MKLLVIQIAAVIAVICSESTVQGTRLVACEHQPDKRLECPSGQYITIFKAYYGRLDGSTCGHGPDTQCYAGNSPGIIRDKCQGKRSCTLEPKNSVFGDPCRGTVKYIELDYECESAESSPRRVVACEHAAKVTASCPSGTSINVIEAYYGRKNSATCGYYKETNCAAGGSLSTIRNLCHGKSQCELHASNSVFGDPCVGTVKYIDLKYDCKSTVQGTRLVACEHQADKRLECPSGQYINIFKAYYGRLDGSTCGHGPDTQCYAGNSPGIIRDKCQGKGSCTLEPKNSVFGDPCRGTVKYIELDYECTSKPVRNKAVCEGSTGQISCPAGHMIEVKRAFYGRRDAGICGFDKRDSCQAGVSSNQIKLQCNGRNSCNLQASNDVYGDPCFGVRKYTSVDYFCIPYESAGLLPRRVVACEHAEKVTASCPSGSYINVVEAYYGRKHSSICGYHKVTNCAAGGSLSKLKELCQGKNRCELHASNSVFGDPCVGTVKYIELKYDCNVDECKSGTAQCTQICTKTSDSYECSCNEGYKLDEDGFTCGDVDECSSGTAKCTQTCTNNVGSFECSCNDGYELDEDGFTCRDIDECTTGAAKCTQTCTNNIGSFECSCNDGYELDEDGFTCRDINECTSNSHNCAADATCTNHDGSFACACNAGFNGDGTTCTDINECASNSHNCAADATCTNHDGSFACACNAGFNGDGTTCTDVDECKSGTAKCEQTCTNNIGSFECSCNEGYELDEDGFTCRDIDECAMETHACLHQCSNNEGSYECACHEGFYLDKDNTTCKELLNLWTRSTEGCQCYYDPSRYDCPCCITGGCQCAEKTSKKCVQCGYGEECKKSALEDAAPCLYARTRKIKVRAERNNHIGKCDRKGRFEPMQCDVTKGSCWCVDSLGKMKAGTEMFTDEGKPNCESPHLLDGWTKSTTGCLCSFDKTKTRRDCACCVKGGCSCGVLNPNMCTQCGLPQACSLPRESLVQNLRKWMTKLQKEFPIQSAELQEQLAVLQEQTAQKFPEMKDAVGLLKGINLEEE